MSVTLYVMQNASEVGMLNKVCQLRSKSLQKIGQNAVQDGEAKENSLCACSISMRQRPGIRKILLKR